MSDQDIRLRAENKIKLLRSKKFIDQVKLSEIENLLASGEILPVDAINRLDDLEKNSALWNASPETITEDWDVLSKIIQNAEDQLRSNTKWQTRIGIVSLPLFIAVILGVAIWGGFQNEIKQSIVPVLAATMTTLVIHTFFILRTQQQSSIAMERLTEKRLGSIFLKLASGSAVSGESADRLTEAGLKMFLEHYAPKSIPLNPEDMKSSKSSTSKDGK